MQEPAITERKLVCRTHSTSSIIKSCRKCFGPQMAASLTWQCNPAVMIKSPVTVSHSLKGSQNPTSSENNVDSRRTKGGPVQRRKRKIWFKNRERKQKSFWHPRLGGRVVKKLEPLLGIPEFRSQEANKLELWSRQTKCCWNLVKN